MRYVKTSPTILGDTNMFTDIEGYAGVYGISRSGEVIRKGTGRILKTGLRSGYPSLTLCKNNIKKFAHVHRLIALTFIPNPNNLPCVNHIDGNKENNTISNLEWCTFKENSMHAVRLGLISKDTCIKRNPSARYLTLEQAEEIRQRYVSACRINGARALGKIYGIPHTAVLLIIKGKTYTH